MCTRFPLFFSSKKRMWWYAIARAFRFLHFCHNLHRRSRRSLRFQGKKKEEETIMVGLSVWHILKCSNPPIRLEHISIVVYYSCFTAPTNREAILEEQMHLIHQPHFSSCVQVLERWRVKSPKVEEEEDVLLRWKLFLRLRRLLRVLLFSHHLRFFGTILSLL